MTILVIVMLVKNDILSADGRCGKLRGDFEAYNAAFRASAGAFFLELKSVKYNRLITGSEIRCAPARNVHNLPYQIVVRVDFEVSWFDISILELSESNA